MSRSIERKTPNVIIRESESIYVARGELGSGDGIKIELFPGIPFTILLGLLPFQTFKVLIGNYKLSYDQTKW